MDSNRKAFLKGIAGGIFALSACFLLFKAVSGGDDKSLERKPGSDSPASKIAERVVKQEKAAPKPKREPEPPPPPPDLGKAPASLDAKIESILDDLSNLSAKFSGSELRQEQLNFVGALATGDKLNSSEKLALAKNLHLAVPDMIASACWTHLVAGASNDSNFKIEELSKDLPSGALGKDFLSVSASALALMGKRISSAELDALKLAAGTENYAAFLGNYALGFAKTEPLEAFNILTTNKDILDNGSMSRVVANIESPEVYEKVASSDLLLNQDKGSNQRVVEAMVSGWVAVAPSAAADWVSDIPDPKLKSSAAEALISRWTDSDLRGASKWLASTNLEGMDASIGILSQKLARYSPDEARLWAEQIKDEKKRAQALGKIKN